MNYQLQDKIMPPTSQIVIYQTEDGRTKIDVRFENETVWLTQALIAQLFQTTPQNITIHIKNIYEEDELLELATCKDFLQVQQEGGRAVTRTQKHYNLDMIISVGYRVKSSVATKFRQWATGHIREYIVKGFVLDDERLKNPIAFAVITAVLFIIIDLEFLHLPKHIVYLGSSIGYFIPIIYGAAIYIKGFRIASRKFVK